MSWFSEGEVAADAMAAASASRRSKNFYMIKDEEAATIRFLKRASESVNYKRAFLSHAKGQKFQTSYGTPECPLVKAGKQLQASFAFPIIDRRVLKIKDRQTGAEKEIGPRIMYFADGQRTRSQLIAFEKDMLAVKNEERAEDGLDPLTLDDYNLTHYDVRVHKPQKAPWSITQKRPKELTKEDLELVEKETIDLREELKPLPLAELTALVGGAVATEAAETSGGNDPASSYSYETDDDDTIALD